MPYAPATADDERRMLERIGVASVDDLYADVPDELRFAGELDIPLGIGEAELVADLGRLAERNVHQGRETSFLGCGSWDHYVPAICSAVTSRSEFATSYTPYQPEISQGTLQAVFEFQTAISELTGLPVANASLYDGATAVAEACYLAQQSTRRTRVVVLRSVQPDVRRVLATYASAYGMRVDEVAVDPSTGTVPIDVLASALGDDVAAVVVQQPNAFGRLEEAPALVEAAAAAGAVPIVSVDPLSLGLLESPGAYGAAVAVGDGQALGNPSGFGGPTFGFMAADERYVRRMPGRIVGETVDASGERGYVLTLQTREQHIRRDRATSNICTNQSLNALAGIVYLSWLGPGGLDRLGTLLMDRARVARARLAEVPGVRVMHDGPVFKEFLVCTDRPAADVVRECKQRGIHPGWTAARDWAELDAGALLVAVTEQRTDDDIERLAAVLEEVAR